MQKMKSKCDRKVIINEGFMYKFDEFSADKQFWKCSQKNFCLARIYTNSENLTVLKIEKICIHMILMIPKLRDKFCY